MPNGRRRRGELLAWSAGSPASSLTMTRKHLAVRYRGNCRSKPLWAPQDVNGGTLMRRLTDIVRCEKAAASIEYGLVAVLIAVAAIAAFNNLASRINVMYNNVSNHM